MAVRSVTHPLAVLLACVLLGTCTPSALAEAQEEVDGACVKATTCPAPSASELSQDRTFFDDASSVQHVFSQSNVMVATDNPDGFFWKDGGRFIQSCVSPTDRCRVLSISSVRRSPNSDHSVTYCYIHV